MECVTFLFPESDSQPIAYCTRVLALKEELPLKERGKIIDEVLKTDKLATRFSSNYRGLYFQENVRSFLSPLVQSGYPQRLTLIRERIKGSSLSSADKVFVSPSSEDNRVFSAPTVNNDYLVLVAWHSITTCDTSVCVTPCGNKKVVNVSCDNKCSNIELLPNSSIEIWDWLSRNHSPRRIFDKNPKHDIEHLERRGVASEWGYDQETSQQFLDKAVLQNKRRLVFFDKETERLLVFPCQDKVNNLFHAFSTAHFVYLDNEARKILIELGVME